MTKTVKPTARDREVIQWLRLLLPEHLAARQADLDARYPGEGYIASRWIGKYAAADRYKRYGATPARLDRLVAMGWLREQVSGGFGPEISLP